MSETNENPEKDEIKKRCFIITPVGPDNSSIRRAAEGVIDSAIIPVLDELGFETDVPHRLFSSGSITKSVINNIVNDDLVIANLTGLNPNVMYELGIRHTARRPIVHICESGTQLPFDIAPERTLFYVNDMLGIKDFKPKLKEFIIAAINEDEPSNPVYDAIQAKSIMQNVGNDDPLKYVLKAIEDLKSSGLARESNKAVKYKYPRSFLNDDFEDKPYKFIVNLKGNSRRQFRIELLNFLRETYGIEAKVNISIDKDEWAVIEILISEDLTGDFVDNIKEFFIMKNVLLID